ncbi:MAG: biotin--[acetyl-CoA-carboxylase] ligase [Clostridia bacterium]|nr:biotin--[acetyl-CoA-carboxylase] ligase [Clostridia bacterium]
MLDQEKLSSLIKDSVSVFVYDTVTSTNDVAKELCKTNDGCILVVADGQTNGRGRQGKSFFSPKGSGLYFSMVFPVSSPTAEFAGVTCAVAVACSRAIKKITDLDVKIKWVNDIYIENRKACGILVQSVSENGVITKLIVGIGINISTVDFPDEIKDIATSLGKRIDRNILAAEIANNISELIFKNPDDYIDEYREKSNVIGKEITYFQNNIAHKAQAVDIDKNGGLVVNENGKTITLTSGEITVRFPL